MRSRLNMKNALHTFVVALVAGTVVGFAQQARVRPLPDQIPSISQRPTGSSLGMSRVGASDNNIWFGWRVGVAAASIKGTLSDVLAAADAWPISLPAVVASNTLIVSAEVPKPLDHRLQRGERNAVKY